VDILATFPDTQSVLQAEQILFRRHIPFETVPQSLYRRRKCGLGILFDEKFRQAARQALGTFHLLVEFTDLKK
jgi:hypothetical protein